MEVFKDTEGEGHLIFDKSAIYDDSQMGEKLSDFEVLQILGAYNNIHIISKVRSLKNNKLYAIKRVELNKIKVEEEKQLCLQQMNKLIKINNPHLLKYYKYFTDQNNNLYMVYEYMNNSDLNSFIKAHQILQKDIKEEQIWNILLQCLSGLEYLHKENLSHLAIKPTNIFLNNEQNAKIGLFYDTPKLEDKNYNIKKDIYFLGLYFYKMCYANYPFVKDKDWIEDITLEMERNDDYSPELLQIINEMVKRNPDERKSAEQLYNIVKSKYVLKYTKITSIDSVLNCLYSFSNFTTKLLQTENMIVLNKDKFYISYWLLRTIKNLDMEANLNECLEEFKRVLASENSKIDASKEVDPVYLLAFLFENIHKEGNKRKKTELVKEEKEKQYIINSIYKVEEEDDKSNKDQMLFNFFYYFQENVHSIISDLFFGFIKRKRICTKCKNGVYSFSNFCIAPFDVSKLGDNNIFDLIQDGFKKDRYDDKSNNKPLVFCDRCLTEEEHFEFNHYYCIGRNLTIFFYRGKNYQSFAKINFPEYLDIKVYTDIKEQTPIYKLIGSINRVINNGTEQFIYFIKDPKKENFWKSSYGNYPLEKAPISAIQNSGQIILLFYKAIKSQ